MHYKSWTNQIKLNELITVWNFEIVCKRVRTLNNLRNRSGSWNNWSLIKLRIWESVLKKRSQKHTPCMHSPLSCKLHWMSLYSCMHDEDYICFIWCYCYGFCYSTAVTYGLWIDPGTGRGISPPPPYSLLLSLDRYDIGIKNWGRQFVGLATPNPILQNNLQLTQTLCLHHCRPNC